MSIKNRIDDARLLYAQGRKEGALLSVLVAVAATSRKRYPPPPKGKKPTKPTEFDRGAFEAFVKDAIHRTWGVANYNVLFRGKQTPLEAVLYRFVRCELAHEGTVPNDIVFDPPRDTSMTLWVDVKPDRLALSDSLLDGLVNRVMDAPENAGIFAPRPQGQ